MSEATRLVRIARKTVEATDICSFELVDPEGRGLPPFSAGSHIDVHVRPGLVRQYSLCNDPGENHRYQIAVLRDPASRGGSSGIHDTFQEGDVIAISEPRNHFQLVQAQRYLLFAGGIGITPILCMAERLAQLGADFAMHYCTRSFERTAFHARILDANISLNVAFHFDTGQFEQKLDLMAVLGKAGSDTHLYVCGPAGFIDHVVRGAKTLGWSPDRIHLEYFGAAPAATGGDALFVVKIASSGQRYEVPADQTVVQALAEQGVEIPVSCEQGVCGTCITRVLGGIPDHRDLYFSVEEHAKNDQFTPCCSRALTSELVLDL